MNKEKFLVLFLNTYSITAIVFYELTEASHHVTKCIIFFVQEVFVLSVPWFFLLGGMHATVNHWVYFRM
jgi:hypothetical protein